MVTTTLPTKHITTREGDGYRVHRVPIFATHERVIRGPDGKPRKVTVDESKLTELADRMNARAKLDNYLPPVHPVHNDQPNDGSRVAYMVDARVEDAVFEGRYQPILFVDYLVDDEETYSAEKKLQAIDENAYRSPEVNLGKSEIHSLSVMKRQAPFFKFPLFKRSGLDEEGSRELAAMGSGGVAFASYGDEYSVLYNAASYSTEQDRISDKIKVLRDEGYPQDQAVAAAIRMVAPEKSKSKKYEDDMGPEDKMPAVEVEETPTSEDGGGIRTMFEKYGADMGRACAEAFRANLKDMFGEEEMEPGTDVKIESDDPVVMAADKSDALYRMQGMMEALTNKVESLYQDREKSDFLRWARDEVQGYSVGDMAKFTAQVTEIYADKGPVAAKSFVSGLTSGTPPIPVPTEDEVNWGSAAPANEPAEVAMYRGTPNYKKAIALYREYQQMPRMMRDGVNVADHIANYIV